MRFYKTRTQATDACDENKISIGGHAVKPSKQIKIGDEIILKWPGGLNRTIKVIQLAEKRLGAKLVGDYCKELTPKEDMEAYKSRLARASAYRDRGAGRPTKKDRRDMDNFMDAVDDLFD